MKPPDGDAGSPTAAPEAADPFAPLPPERVRWFSSREAFSLKGYMNAPEVPHKGALLRFNDLDSLALELAYRERADELERSWWEEEAELQAGPGPGAAADATQGDKPSGSPTKRGSASGAGSPGKRGSSPSRKAPYEMPDWQDFMAAGGGAGEEVGVPVRGGAWEVDLPARALWPCYWPAPCARVHRGTWFAEKAPDCWVPLKHALRLSAAAPTTMRKQETLADQLEAAHQAGAWLPERGHLAPQPAAGEQAPLLAARIELMTRVDTGYYALFASATDAWLCRNGSFAWLRRLGGGTAGAETRLRLRRGYEPPASRAGLEREADVAQEEGDAAASATPASRLLLVVHGIGQTLSAANIANDVAAFRTALRTAGGDAAGGAELEGGAGGRTEVLPVQWRKHLSLEVDAVSEALMPPGVRALRQVLHATAVEVLLYVTPLHRADIIGSLVAGLNSVYARFMLRNPGFQGPVSILAHSLGSVMCFDVLCNQPPPGGSPRASPRPPTAATAAGPPGAEELRQEVERLRRENQRLALQLEVARAEAGLGPRPTASGSPPGAQPVRGHCPAPAGTGWAGGPVAEVAPLLFSVDQLILLGSPLGCFLALRGVNPGRGLGLGCAASAPLMQLSPERPAARDGLPAVRRLLNLFHPFDPVGFRLEPLALGPDAPRRAAFVPYHKGGRRLHVSMQEFGEDVSSAASRLGASLSFSFASLSLSKMRGAASRRSLQEGRSAAQPAADAAAAEEGAEGPAAVAASLSEPVLGAAARAEAPVFGAEGAAELAADVLPGSSPPGASPAASPDKPAGRPAAAPTNVWRVLGGPPAPGDKSARGRLDFVLQEATLENQYLSALSSHFSYWSSPDTALFVLRAVHGVDVLAGEPARTTAAAQSQAGAAAPLALQGA